MEHRQRQLLLPRKVSFLAALIPLLLVLSIGAVTAQEAQRREVKVNLSQSKAVIESRQQTAETKDLLKIEFDNGSHNILLEFESEDAGSDLDAKVKVELFDLIEWTDVNGNGQYDPNISEEMVQKIGLGDLVSQSLDSQAQEMEGAKGVKITGVTAAPAKYPRLSMTLTLWMFGDFLDINGVDLEPTAMKFDINIQNFPYQRQDTNLALYAKVTMDAEEDAKVEGEDEDALIAGRIGKYVSFFSWGGQLTVDGQAREVGQTVIKQESQQSEGDASLVGEVYLLYPRGASIIHDPKLGVQLPDAAGGGCTPFR